MNLRLVQKGKVFLQDGDWNKRQTSTGVWFFNAVQRGPSGLWSRALTHLLDLYEKQGHDPCSSSSRVFKYLAIDVDSCLFFTETEYQRKPKSASICWGSRITNQKKALERQLMDHESPPDHRGPFTPSSFIPQPSGGCYKEALDHHNVFVTSQINLLIKVSNAAKDPAFTAFHCLIN